MASLRADQNVMASVALVGLVPAGRSVVQGAVAQYCLSNRSPRISRSASRRANSAFQRASAMSRSLAAPRSSNNEPRTAVMPSRDKTMRKISAVTSTKPRWCKGVTRGASIGAGVNGISDRNCGSESFPQTGIARGPRDVAFKIASGCAFTCRSAGL